MVLLYLAVGPFFYPTHTENVIAYIGAECSSQEVALWSETRKAHHICVAIEEIEAALAERSTID